MTKQSSTQKVIKVDKRLLNEQKTSLLTGSVLYTIWGVIAGIITLAAGASFITTDLEERRADTGNPQIDTITTAGVSSGSRSINIAQRRKQVLAAKVQKQKVDDLSRVIHRLRGEQISLNNRIAELETTLRETQERTKSLESELKSAPKRKSTVASAPRLAPPSAPVNLNPERNVKNELQAKTVRTVTPDKPQKKIAKAKIAKSVTKKPKTKAQKAGTSVYTKTKSAKKQKVDKTVVGSINRAETAKFAIDLGVNPTKSRAQDLWQSLKKNKPSTLSLLTPKYILTGNNEGETRIVAGPFLDASDAIKACVAIRSAEAFCKTTLFPK